MSSATTKSSGDEYVDFCEGVRRLCQIDLLQYKRAQMERRIRTFVQRRGVIRLSDYLGVLRAEREELDRFLDRITINVSQLWRNPEQWRVIGDTILPELAGTGEVRAWSAGCSYGAEAYTLAAVALETVPGAHVHVLGTDIDERIVGRAREGQFSAEDARDAPAAALERHFLRTEQGWQARPELRRLVRFEIGDLLRSEPERDGHDLILCRNTVIYFQEPVRDDVHARLAGALRSGGYLIVGATERVSACAEVGLEPVRPFTYRKR